MQYTLAEAREQLFKEAATKDGGICPCCDRFTKIYNRKFNKAMAFSLCWLYRENIHRGQVWASIGDKAPRKVVRNGGSLATCAWWGLVRQRTSDSNPEKRTSGLWQITEQGIQFVECRITIPSHATTYNAQVIEFNHKQKISIAQALGRPFHYTELMEALP